MSDVKGSLDYGRLRRALREELAWRSGIKWFAGVDWLSYNAKGVRGKKPYILLDPYYAKRINEDLVMIVDHAARQVIFVDNELNILKEFGRFGVAGDPATGLFSDPSQAQYDEELGTVLVADLAAKAVVERDYATGAVKHVLTSTELGPFGPIYTAYYNPFDKSKIIVCDAGNHVVVETDWTGKAYRSLGAYGVSGETISPLRLKNPGGAHPFKVKDRVFISDGGNHRVLQGNLATGAVERVFVYPAPVRCELMPDSWFLFASAIERCSVAEGGDVFWWWFEKSNMLTRAEREPSFMVTWHFDLYEVDWRTFKPFCIPKTNRVWTSLSLSANTPSTTRPTLGFGYDRLTFFVKPTQGGTLEILTLKPKGWMLESELTWPPSWEVYDSVSLTANSLTTYIVSNPHGVMAARVTLTTAGTCDLWVSQEVSK